MFSFRGARSRFLVLIVIVACAQPIGACDAIATENLSCKPLGEFKLLPNKPAFLPHDAEVDDYIRAPEARVEKEVNGQGMAAVVIDSGLNYLHDSLKEAVISDENGAPLGCDLTRTDLLDHYGHGTGVAGLIAGKAVPNRGITSGIAPGAKIIPIKVYTGSSDLEVPLARIVEALRWIEVNRNRIERHGVRIGVVNMSFGYRENATQIGTLANPQYNEIKDLIQSLRDEEIAVVVASGNEFHSYSSEQGMDFPAICDPAISVGAVFDVTVDLSKKQVYPGDCWVKRAERDRITPFSQRLSAKRNSGTNTTIFAPGHNVSTASRFDAADNSRTQTGASANDGTSRSAPIVAGAILLVQQRYRTLRSDGLLPSVTKVERAIVEGGVPIDDIEESPAGTYDSVQSTGDAFCRLDVLGALNRIDLILDDDLSTLRISAESGGTATGSQ